MREPTEAQIADFNEAIAHGNFPPCTCHVLTGFGHYRVCQAHAWLTEVDKRSTPIMRWQRLLFIRAMRERFEAQEHGQVRSPEPVDTRGTLPW